MISEKTLTIDWIEDVSKKNNNADRILVEKVARALLLLEGLVECGLDFTFKGGTALMLLQDSTRRLSIDIDIVLPKKTDLESCFKSFFESKNFIRFESQDRKTAADIEKLHYKFYYNPAYKTKQNEEYILLDILIEETLYKNTLSIDIHSTFVHQKKEPLKVPTPTLEGLLGDKLTAFAPNTTGIPYEKGGHSRAMEIVKQLYDIGNLFEDVENVEEIRKTFEGFALKELSYRKLGKDPQVVLQDIYETALCITTRGRVGNGNIQALQRGVQQVTAFIFSERYNIEKAIVHASKAAYLSKLIEFKKDQIERFENPQQIGDWMIEGAPLNRLNKLKKSNPEAFFYWYKSISMKA